MNILQSATYLKISPQSLYRYLSCGQIKATKWKGAWRIEKKELNRFYREGVKK